MDYGRTEVPSYVLTEKKSDKLEMFKVEIMADSNYAYYITTTGYYTLGEFEEIVPELINLKLNYGGPHQLLDYPNEMELNIPWIYGEYCHTLKRLTIEYTDENGKNWDVELLGGES